MHSAQLGGIGFVRTLQALHEYGVELAVSPIRADGGFPGLLERVDERYAEELAAHPPPRW